MGTEVKVRQLWFDEDKIFILTEDGRELWQSLLWYSRLLYANAEQRNSYHFSYSGIHWPDVDEDISFESFFYDKREPAGISRLFLTHPELNASAVARKMGIQQSLLAAYIRGTKKPSKERENAIITTVKQIGEGLAAVEV
jgi:hypothetical protein